MSLISFRTLLSITFRVLLIVTFFACVFLEDVENRQGLWSLFSLPFRPLGLVIILLYCSWCKALIGGTRRHVANTVLVALLILWITSMPVVAYWLVNQKVQSVFNTIELQSDSLDDLKNVQAIVVLGDDTSSANPSYQFQSILKTIALQNGFQNTLKIAQEEKISEDAAESTKLSQQTLISLGGALMSRLLYSAQLYQDQIARGSRPLLIVSAGVQSEWGSEKNDKAKAIMDFLVAIGVPKEVVFIDSEGEDIHSSAVAVKKILHIRGFDDSEHKLILVTPVINILRASSTFAQLDISVILKPKDFLVFQLADKQMMGGAALIPRGDALALTTRVVDEHLLSAYYFLRGWLKWQNVGDLRVFPPLGQKKVSVIMSVNSL